jgi:hypothetical protein
MDNFFKSSPEKKSSNLFLQKTDNSAKKRRKSNNERGSNEADDKKDKVRVHIENKLFRLFRCHDIMTIHSNQQSKDE